MYAWAMSAMNAPLSEVLKHQREKTNGHLDIALTAALEQKRVEMIWGE